MTIRRSQEPPCRLPPFSPTPHPPRGALRAPRSWLHSDAPSLSLNGDWRFRLSPTADLPDDVARAEPRRRRLGHHPGSLALGAARRRPLRPPDLHERAVPVPDRPAVRARREPDRRLPAPLRPARRAGPTAARVVLRFDGVESLYRVWLNGVEVGSRERQPARPGVRRDRRAARRATTSSPCACTSGRPPATSRTRTSGGCPGIFRDVTLSARPVGGIDDVWLRTAFAAGAGTIDPEVTADDGRLPGHAVASPSSASRPSGRRPADVAPVEVGAVEPWTAETPRLYDATVAAHGRDRLAAPRLPHRRDRRRPVPRQRPPRRLPRREPPRDAPRPRPRLRRGARPRRPVPDEAVQRQRDPHQPLPAAPAPARPRRRARLLGHPRVRPRDARLREGTAGGTTRATTRAGATPTSTASSAPSSATRTTRRS